MNYQQKVGLTTEPLACPECGDVDAVWGTEVLGVYDGVLYWYCAACGTSWPRDFGEGDRLTRLSREYAGKAGRGRRA